MTTIEWTATQKALNVTPDGVPGDVTWTAILRTVAGVGADLADLLAMARALKTFGASLGGLVTPARLAGFVSNCANETGGFVKWQEGLIYTAKRMAEVWPARYSVTGKSGGAPNALAVSLAGKPVAFANATYGSRMGNRPGSDVGYAFRGLGPLQITGRTNFEAAERQTGLPFLAQPDLMAHPGAGTIGALSWWSRSGCNAELDRGSPKRARSIANAGRPDVDEPEGWPRVSFYHDKLMAVLR